MTEDDSFFGRWSRRKRALDRAQPAAAPVPPPEPDAEPEPPPALAAAPETLTDEELAALPRIEDLTEGSDITAFLRPGVPRALKNAARRQVWMATPAIRDYRDPAVDYAWDWNTPGGVPGDGCAPSPERAARMLRDLLDPREPTAPDAPAATDPATPEPAPDDALPAEDPADSALAQGVAPAPPPSEQAQAGARQHHAPPSTPASGDPSSQDGPDRSGPVAAAVPQRRRHGGALPG